MTYPPTIWPPSLEDLSRLAPWAGAGLGFVVASAWVLRTAVVLHNKKIAVEDSQQIVVPAWHYAACVVAAALLADILVSGAMVAAFGEHRLLEALLATVSLRLFVHAGVLSWLLAARFHSAMSVQVFEIAIFLTFAPLVGSMIVVLCMR